jgi:hypothetical protein
MEPTALPPLSASPKPKRPWYKRLFRAFLWCLAILIVLILVPVVLLFVYEKEIKAAIISEINTHLKTKVYISPDNIDLTILRTFPQAALVFRDVTVMGALPELKNDTLLHARSIYLLFNAKDLWNRKYEIQHIQVHGSRLHLQTNREGFSNYDVWEGAADTVKKQEKGAEFRLRSLRFDELDLGYRNAQSKIRTAASLAELVLSGNFSDEEYALELQVSGRLEYIRNNKRSLIRNKNLTARVAARVKGKTYTLTEAEIALNKLSFTARGWLSRNDTAMPAEISFKGKNIDAQSILSWLPEDSHDKIKDYASEGIFYSELKLAGNLSDYNSLDIKASFGTDKSKLTYVPTRTTLTEVSFTGSFVKEKFHPERLELKNIRARQQQNFVSGEFTLSNFASPYLKLKAKGNYDLASFFALVPLDTLQEAKGMIDFEVEGNINLNEARSKRIGTSTMEGKISVKEVELKFRGGQGLRVPGGYVVVENENLETRNLVLIHGRSTVDITGRAGNFLNYLLKPDQPLVVDLVVKSAFIDADDCRLPAPAGAPAAGAAPAENPFNVQEDLAASLKLEIGEVVFRTFRARSLAGTLEIRHKKLLAKNFSFEAFGGDITLTGVADASEPHKLGIKGSTSLVEVNVKQMFSELNNFGQEVIDASNLNGKATTQVDFSATWNNKLECDLKSIVASADLNIANGELVNYKMLEALGEYVDLKELKHVKFATLQTHVDIRNETVFLSKTTVKNSALDLDISGWQTFDSKIDYHVKLRLSDWLAKRPGKDKKLDEELMETENDPENRRCVFIRMTGTLDKPEISYDRKAMKQKIREDIKEEKQNLKKILNEEFGWFKKDSTLKKTEQKQDPKFRIDFNQKKKDEDKKEEEDDDDF